MSTSITVEFQINDLDANYEIIGVSKNYSFEEKLGKGSELVFDLGEVFVKNIPLNGNYGIFDVRVFSVTDIGVRSPSLVGSVEVLPQEFDGTFTFSEIKINNNRFNDLNSVITQSPSEEGGLFVVESEFAEKNINFSWSLVPPQGHLLEGGAVSTQLLNDTFFSHFRINIKNDGEYIDLDKVGFSSNSLNSLANNIQTQAENVSDILGNYRDFKLNINENVFNDLNLSRNVEFELVSVDRFGREATGILKASNAQPIISNLTHSIRGSDVSFSWESEDTDFKDVEVNVLAVPNGIELPFSRSIEENVEYFQSLKLAKEYGAYKGASYVVGDKAKYGDQIYVCVSGHTRAADEYPFNSSNWQLFGDSVDFINFSFSEFLERGDASNLVQDNTLNNSFTYEGQNSFMVPQMWGYNYYYSFTPSDGFGEGFTYNFTEEGLVRQEDFSANLAPIISNISISNLRFRELGDDLVFNWDITDQDGQLVDINQYKFIFGQGDTPSLLGISGSLFDADSGKTVYRITEGNNSKGLEYDEYGDLVVSSNLPSAKVFDQYKYTREQNNQIYGTGGFPAGIESYDNSSNYTSGQKVVVDEKIYQSLLVNGEEHSLTVYPVYDEWDKSKMYFSASSDAFLYDGNIYSAEINFGPNADSVRGIFKPGEEYSEGDIVISPDFETNIFSDLSEYNVGDIVLYEGSVYECLSVIQLGVIAYPEDRNYWRRLDIFKDIRCSYFISKINNNENYPFSNISSWEKLNPENMAKDYGFLSILAPAYELPVVDWSSNDQYNRGDFVVYNNQIWSGVSASLNQIPGGNSEYWSSGDGVSFGLYSNFYGRNYNSGDLVSKYGTVYKCVSDDPRAAPLLKEGDQYNSFSEYQSTDWIPFWFEDDSDEFLVFGHQGIPQSGKRSVGIELGIVDKYGNIVNKANLTADNPPPYILRNGFNVDSLSEASKVKFNFNYALGFQEKTTHLYLYRSDSPDFDVVDEQGFPVTGEGSAFVKNVIGAGDSTFGQNITQLTDEPPIPKINGIDQITGYYYKLLPFDDFGSGVLYEVSNNAGPLERVLVYPKRYNHSNPNIMPGRVLRADPTSSEGAVPGPPLGLSGSTAFENFFLNWRSPDSEYEIGTTSLVKQKPNDIDYYEVWASDSQYLFTESSSDQYDILTHPQNTGYRKIDGVMYSVGDIPKEFPDPAIYISGAENIFNIPASSPSLETIYPGKTNETKSFWVRAVDFAGNKSPFAGSLSQDNSGVAGLTLTLGQASATDISDFEINMTEKFGNSIALIPNNPFLNNSPEAGYVSWVDHVLYYQGTGYLIEGGNTNSGYIWWDVDELPNERDYHYGSLNNIRYSGAYKLSDAHPQGGYNSKQEYIDKLPGFSDDDFIIARNSNGLSSTVSSAIPNALIGSANIADAAIIDAKINTLSADKITAGSINGHKIQISHSGDNFSDNYGSISSKDYQGLVYNSDYPNILDENSKGFVLSGDGRFAFQQGKSSLSFQNDSLVLRGRIKQVDGSDYDFISVDARPSFFHYSEDEVGFFLSDENPDCFIEIFFRNTSIKNVSDVELMAYSVYGDPSNPLSTFTLFDFTDLDLIDGSDSKYRFEYIAGSFNASEENSTVSARVKLPAAGFDLAMTEQPGAESIVVVVKGKQSTHQGSTTISRLNDGKSAEIIRLVADSQTFNLDRYGNIVGASEINIVAHIQNNNQLVQWTASNGVKIYNQNNQEISQSSFVDYKNVKIKVADFGDSDKCTVSAKTEPTQNNPANEDSVSFAIVKDGSNAINMMLSNETHTLTQYLDEDRNTKINSSLSGTTIEVLDGAEYLVPYSQGDYNNLNDKSGAYYVTEAVGHSDGRFSIGTKTIDGVNKVISFSNILIESHDWLTGYIQFIATGTKRNGESFTIRKYQTFSVSIRGEDSQSIRLSASSQILNLDSYGNPIGNEEVIINAYLNNNNQPLNWSSDNGVKIYSLSNQEINQSEYVDNKTVKIKLSDFGSNRSTKISVETLSAENNPVDRDEMSFFIVQAGSNSITAFVSNETHSLREYLDSEGSLKISSDFSGTDISVLDGSEYLDAYTISDYQQLTDKAGSYYVEVNLGHTDNRFTMGAQTIDSNKTKVSFANIQINSHNWVNGYTQFDIIGKKKNGENFQVTKFQTFSVASRGIDGLDGASASSLRLVANTQSFISTRYGGLDPDSEISIYAFLQNNPQNIKWQASNGVKIYDSFGVEIDQSSYVDNNSIRVKAGDFGNYINTTVSATTFGTQEYPALIDQVGLTILREGSNAISIILSNESHNLIEYLSSSDGIVISEVLSGTAVTVYDGSVSLDPYTQADYEALADQSGSYYITATSSNPEYFTPGTQTQDRVNNYASFGNINLVSYNFLIGYITFTVRGRKINGDEFFESKIQTFSVSKRGTDGIDGMDGVAGSTPSFRGQWESGQSYYYTTPPAVGQAGRGDIVYYPVTLNGSPNNYWICIQSHTSDDFVTDYQSGKWGVFGNEFKNTATDILLANDAFITNSLVVGNESSEYGEIKSYGYTSAYAGGDYSAGGFSLISSGGYSYLDIGGSRTVGETSVPSYFRFNSDSGKIQIRGSFTNNSSSEDISASLNNIIDGSVDWGSISVIDTLATFIGGGYDNFIVNPESTNNYLSLASAILSGGNNYIQGRFSTILGGYGNSCVDNFSTICGGYLNSMPQEGAANEGGNFIGSGQQNRITGGTNQAILAGNNNVIFSS